MKLSWIIALGAGALVMTACSGGKSSLGSGDKDLETGGTSSGGSAGKGGESGSGAQSGSGGESGSAGKAGSGGSGGYNPCAGAACGAPCSPCDPKDPNCASDAVIHYCGTNGSCTAAYPDCGTPGTCNTDSECATDLGPCQICPDGSFSCPSAHCIGGKCVGSFQGCGGTKCAADSDCPALGAPCQPCPDGSFSCPSSKCVNGTCVSGFPGCTGYQPCAGKKCGEFCTQCDPAAKDCAETAVIKYCDEAGTCSPTAPKCGGAGECKIKTDCIAIDICMYCPGVQGCAAMDCVNGKCEFVCPPNPTPPQCKTTLDCPVREVCKPCADGRCAATQCVNGSCQLVCGL